MNTKTLLLSIGGFACLLIVALYFLKKKYKKAAAEKAVPIELRPARMETAQAHVPDGVTFAAVAEN